MDWQKKALRTRKGQLNKILVCIEHCDVNFEKILLISNKLKLKLMNRIMAEYNASTKNFSLTQSQLTRIRFSVIIFVL